MLGYLGRRVGTSLGVVLGISIVVFLVMHVIPGDPVFMMLRAMDVVTEEQIEKIRHDLGLDRPLHIQYLNFLSRAVRGDLGRSISSGRPVADLVKDQLPHTLQLAIAAMLFTVTIGLSLGILAATKQGSWMDVGALIVALGGVSVANFWLGLVLIYVFALRLAWFPVLGEGTLTHLVLPGLALGYEGAGLLARMVRSSLLEVLRQDYITTARSKGLDEARVITRHALRNALIPVLTILGLQFARVLSGTVVIETVFGRRGVGSLAVHGLLSRDITLVQGTVLVVASIYVMINMVVDVLYSVVNPKIRYA